MRIDILIPTYNRSKLLRECLESVLGSTSMADWRVTVIDNNSSDDTKQVVESFIARSERVHYLFEKKQGKSEALNRGISLSDSDVIGMIDDDEHLHPNWIDTVAKWMQDSRIDYLGGPYFGLWRTEEPDWLPAGYEGVISADDPNQIPDKPLRFPDPRIFLRGGNAVVRRSVFDRVGGYRPDLFPCEDHDIYARLLAAGVTGYYVPDLVVYHLVLPERMTRAYFRKWAKGHGLAFGSLDRSIPQNVPYVGRIPRYMIGDAVKGSLALVSLDRARRFAAELRWRTLAYYFYGAYCKAPLQPAPLLTARP
jgi:glycosyltransferase involved in cell wall biosynthesis